MKILVVDDVGFTRHHHAKLLEREGHSVCSAASGWDALKYLGADSSIQLVLTDLLMPRVNGLELFEKASLLAAHRGDPPPHFVLMTAYEPNSSDSGADFQLYQRATQAGFTEIFSKPLKAKVLFDLLTRIDSGKTPRPKPFRRNESGVHAPPPAKAAFVREEPQPWEDPLRQSIRSSLASNDPAKIHRLLEHLERHTEVLREAISIQTR